MTPPTVTDRNREIAQRLLDSVLPLFLETERGRPDRIGSCVLVRVDGNHFAFTAGHVIRDHRACLLWAAPASNARLQPLPCAIGFHTPAPDDSPNDLDIGLLPLRA